MKKYSYIFALTLILLLMSGCTVQKTTFDVHGFPPYVTVDMSFEPLVQPNKQTILTAKVSNGGEATTIPSLATFAVWPEGQPEHAIQVEAEQTTEGTFTAPYTFAAEGLYVVQFHYKNDTEEVLPAKRLAVGAQAIEQLATLEKAAENSDASSGASEHGGGHGGHHSH